MRAERLFANPRGQILLSLAMILTLFTGNAYAEVYKGTASWYSSKDACRYNPYKGCPTASGKPLYALERRGIPFAAMWDVPFGTRVKVCAQSGCVIAVIEDRGPARRLNRLIDLSRSAFEKIAPLADGLTSVTVEVLDD